ncbi:MAG TPA: glycosyltransferase family 2 protein [Syntrophorhabdaceae bacterium]|nr:glycosyltransferase family 2 protein [Syntrophorhabdaceae bacterium]
MDKKLSIVIVTKDTKALVQGLLSSIKRDTSLAPSIDQVIVMDNGSIDGTVDAITRQYPDVICVRNEQNRGFAAAVNKGYSLSKGEYIIFLNSDTILIEGELTKMIDFMDENPDVAICGPQLVYEDMKPQRSFAALPSLAREILPFKRSGRRTGPGRHPETGAKQSTHPSSLPVSKPRAIAGVPVDSLIGAAILVRAEALVTLNGFDERFFFFLEETDLCVRARRAGYGVVFLPEAKVIHLQGKTVRRHWIPGRIEYNISLYKFIRKHHRPAYYTLFTAIRFTKALIFVVIFSLFFPFLFHGGVRAKYIYYTRLLTWHLKGRPDGAGLAHPK